MGGRAAEKVVVGVSVWRLEEGEKEEKEGRPCEKV